jgi:phosphate transport system protein
MPSDHIVRSFDEELTALHQAIIDIGELSHSQLKAAVEALASHDTARAAAVVKGDSEVDQLERELDARAVRVLALRQPMARDLRQVLSALRIGTEFERISDFAANIAKRSLALGNAGPPELIGDIQSLAGLAAGFLAQVVEAYRTRNAQLAMTVWAQDERLDEAYTLSYHRIVFWMQEAPARVAAGTHLLFIAKNIERIGDHATNIAEWIHFQVSGVWLSEPRPKGDTTSSERIAEAG